MTTSFSNSKKPQGIVNYGPRKTESLHVLSRCVFLCPAVGLLPCKSDDNARTCRLPLTHNPPTLYFCSSWTSLHLFLKQPVFFFCEFTYFSAEQQYSKSSCCQAANDCILRCSRLWRDCSEAPLPRRSVMLWLLQQILEAFQKNPLIHSYARGTARLDFFNNTYLSVHKRLVSFLCLYVRRVDHLDLQLSLLPHPPFSLALLWTRPIL